ncbi:MAG: hypothetical protein LAT64_06790 [Phycisphaerales bacterium]|nr:hypothetical protein [Phycisphaerales bacterium]
MDARSEQPEPADDPSPGAAAAAQSGGVPGGVEKEKDIFGRVPKDRPDWSHRRGEPRVFALLWMFFLMGVTGVMFLSVSDAFYVSPSITRPAARGMILTTMAGLVLLWPAVRLSQRPSARPVRSVLRDLFVLLIPAQAVVWPHALRVLADWPVPVLLATALAMAAWALVIGGVIAMADAGPRRQGGGWMLVVLAVVFAGPVVLGLGGGLGAGLGGGSWNGPRADEPRAGWMLSPLTAIVEITRERDMTGTLTPVTGVHWRLIGATGCVGAALCLLAASRGVASRRGGA